MLGQLKIEKTITVITVIVDELTIQFQSYYEQTSITLSPKGGFFLSLNVHIPVFIADNTQLTCFPTFNITISV